MHLALRIGPCQQLRPRQVVNFLQRFGQRPVVDLPPHLLAALGRITQPDHIPVEFDMARPQGQRAIAAILARVVRISHPQRRAIDQRDGAGQGKAALACLLIQIAGDKAAQARQSMRKIHQACEFRLCLRL